MLSKSQTLFLIFHFRPLCVASLRSNGSKTTSLTHPKPGSKAIKKFYVWYQISDVFLVPLSLRRDHVLKLLDWACYLGEIRANRESQQCARAVLSGQGRAHVGHQTGIVSAHPSLLSVLSVCFQLFVSQSLSLCLFQFLSEYSLNSTNGEWNQSIACIVISADSNVCSQTSSEIEIYSTFSWGEHTMGEAFSAFSHFCVERLHRLFFALSVFSESKGQAFDAFAGVECSALTLDCETNSLRMRLSVEKSHYFLSYSLKVFYISIIDSIIFY